MPVLTHLNNDQNRINKRIVAAMLKQAQVQMPDVPAPPVDSDVNQNYLALMKSLSNILINLQEIYVSRFAALPEGEVDEFDLPELGDFPDGSSVSSGLSGLQSQASYAPFGSQASSVYSQPVSSVASAVSAPFFRRGVNSPASSVYSQPVSQVSSSTGRPSSRYGQERLSQYSEPRRNEQSVESAIRGPNQFISLVLNSLSKEIVNAKFLVEIISFGQLSKIQKQKLMRLMVRINKVKDVIKTGIGKPIYSNLNSVFKLIQDNLSSEGNMPITDQAGNKIRDLSSTEFLLNTASTMPPEQVGEIEAFQGAGRSKHRMLSPMMYNAHNFNPYNVNANFSYNLAKRNI
jgi:hypothetical protein